MKRLRDRPDGTTRDGGFTLAELLVAMTVGLLVLAMVTGGLIMLIGQQRRVVDTGQTGSEVQAAFSGIQRGVRNATADGVEVSDGGRLMVALTGGGTSTSAWRCQAWRYVPGANAGDAGTLYWTIRPQGTALDTVADPVAAGWTVLVENVVTDGGQPVFALQPSGSVRIAMIASRTGQPDDIEAVRMDTEVVRLPQAHSGKGGCFS
ncbi:prepilin-type N-terminal cleavage/methylation domain-containing protein [Cellulomonas hominis]|uniref:prepilin-type N-terminal cleavage/methylation domain-containing protein n=1 Tax=Cellulomonas hominis TaxID=156981 RepID=UPI001C102087|nr:prepilin-type N-terminal cleavage/methylation domain-containing protein [Cellulomonas hominis]MBU5424391.1 prepilin-type N-terminal cleavage/methylation domain-containing protein [Cellulomonas hominis]